MIIGIDGYEANVRERVGVGRYAYEILKHMFQEVKSQKLKVKSNEEICFRVYLPGRPLADMPRETHSWQYRVLSPGRFWTYLGLPIALAMDQPRANVIFSPTHYTPRFITIPRVISIMDLSYLEYPQMFRAKDLHQLVHWTRYSVEHAARIFTISRFSRDAIIREYGIPEEKVVVTYPGLSMEEKGKTKKGKVAKQYNISPRYILSVGTIQPRKNFERLIEAFRILIQKNTGEAKDLELVIVGKKGWLWESIISAPKRLGIENRVRFLDFIPEEDLPALYQHALVFALPSLYEGFGLPVLEAMAYGCPVVVSNTSSLPEIAGDTGIYVDPESVDSIASGLMTALAERGTKQGKDRIVAGKERAKRFTWGKAARQALKVLEEVGRKHS